MKWNSLVGAAVLCLCVTSVMAQEEAVNLDKIVITPSRYGKEIAKTGNSITVIGQQQIEDSDAKMVLDALRTVPGLVVRDWIGNATSASVDIRGFGEQSGMNVAVLIDGRKINEGDLSGTDWTLLPLNEVERIEVIRGGSSVLYGDNATSGVINIITKKGAGKPRFNISTRYGSFDYNSQSLSFSGSEKKLSFWLTSSHEGTNGYRNNSYYKSTDFASKLGYDLTDDVALRFSSGYHKAAFGFPGALTSDDIRNFNRRYSKYGDDHANEKDYYFMLGGKKNFKSLGAIDFDVSYRRRRVYSNFVGANGGWNPVLKNFIDTYSFTPKYTLDNPILGFANKAMIGFDFYRYDNGMDNYDATDVLQNYSDINKTTFGQYVQDEFSILKNLIATGGFRYEYVKYTFNYKDLSPFFPNPELQDYNIKPNRKAFNGSLVYNYMEDSSVFVNLSNSFRFPATDEYFTWGSLNTSLKPQTTRNYEVGIRHKFNEKLSFSLSIFRMLSRNELYYNPIGGPFGLGANENYDKTKRDGMEFTFDSKIYKLIGIYGNYSFIKATFKGGIYDKNDIPMAPRHKGTLGFKFNLPKNVTLNINGNYVAKRYYINDQANTFSRLNGYFTANMNLSYAFKDFTITAGVNNLLNKLYSEYGVCNAGTGAKNYYPNPGRNFDCKIDYKF